jgi:hypothetical protein
MNTEKTTPIISSTAVHNVGMDINRAVELITLDPVQAAKLLQRAINNLHSATRLARFTHDVSVPDYLFVDPNHRVFTPHYTTLD